ncbi:MAG TPA: hypothetical protein VLW50_07635 [Streptosporangiaceae bacterium]|nr:hypothetical protein [Streptosporangiaceae bacterium]
MWKVLGLAAFVGVAATGALIVRDERRRRAYTAEEIRARLHARFTEASPDAGASTDAEAAPDAGQPTWPVS